MTDNKKTTDNGANDGKKPTRRTRKPQNEQKQTPEQDNKPEETAENGVRDEQKPQEPQTPEQKPAEAETGAEAQPQQAANASPIAGLSSGSAANNNKNNGGRKPSSGLKRVFQGAAVGVVGTLALLHKGISRIGYGKTLLYIAAAPYVVGAASVLMETDRNFTGWGNLMNAGGTALARGTDNFSSMFRWGQNTLAAPFNFVADISTPSGPVTDNILLCHADPRNVMLDNDSRAPSADEIRQMRQNVQTAMGPFGYLHDMVYNYDQDDQSEALRMFNDGAHVRVLLDIESFRDGYAPRIIRVEDTGPDQANDRNHVCPITWQTQRYQMR